MNFVIPMLGALPGSIRDACSVLSSNHDSKKFSFTVVVENIASAQLHFFGMTRLAPGFLFEAPPN